MKEEPITQHLVDAADWYQDRYGAVVWQRNWAIVIAILAMVAVFGTSLAIAAMAPLKTIEPYVVRVDQGGAVKVISTLSSTDEQWEELTAEKALIESLLVQYVIARETYSKVDLRRLFEAVRVHSERSVFREYDTKWSDTKNGPFAIYKDDAVEVRVVAVTLLNNETAAVRFKTTWKQTVGQEIGAYVAIVRFRFVREAVVLDDRWANPLGFLVTSYRVDQEQLELK